MDNVISGGLNQSIGRLSSLASLVVLSLAFVGCGQSKHQIGGGEDMPGGTPGVTGGSGGTSAAGKGGTGGKGGKGGKGGTGGGSGGSMAVGNAGTLGDAGTTGGPDEHPTNCGIPSTSQLPRLKNAEYDRTVRDLLGVTTLMGTSAGNVAPSALLGTDHDGALTDVDWAGYLYVGEAVAAQVMADPTLEANFLTCAPSGIDEACLHDSIVSFGRRAFRRPLTEGETTRFDNIVAQASSITEHGTLAEAAEVVLETFLVSPSFLQRTELGSTPDPSGAIQLTSHEVAARLSYLLWGSTPDATLEQAADAGSLVDKASILAQAERMLGDPKAHDAVAGFHRRYLAMGTNTRWDLTQKDATKFPTFTSAVAVALGQETERFFDTLVFTDNAGLGDLFTSPIGFVNAATAPLYGLDPSAYGSDLQQVTLDATQRPGFLTRAGFLAAYSSYALTSPVVRGDFIAKTVQGAEVGPPPPDSGSPMPMGTFDTNRARTEAATNSSDACTSCHSIMNPPGYVLENYDAVGQWQTTEADTGAAIDPVADVTIDGAKVSVKNAADLMKRLATSEDVRKAYAKQWVSYAYQRNADPNDACTVDVLSQNLTRSGYRILDLVADLTQSDSFRLRVRGQ